MRTEHAEDKRKLLSEAERDRIIKRVKQQRFSTNRRNVVPWCGQWMALGFGVLSLPGYVFATHFEWTQVLPLSLPWLLIALLYHESWERYKDRSILKEYLDEPRESKGHSNGA